MRSYILPILIFIFISASIIAGIWFLIRPDQSAQELAFLKQEGFLDENGKPLKSPGLIEQNLNAPDESFEVLATKLDKGNNSYQLAFKLENRTSQNKEFYLIPVSEKDQLEFQEIKGVINNKNILAINKDDVSKQPLETLYDIQQHKKELNPELAKAYDDMEGNNYKGDPIKIILGPNSSLIARSQWQIYRDRVSESLEPVYFLVYGSAGGAKEELTILNVHSYPEQGDNWEVEFTTIGTTDLKIIPQDQATIDDDEFTGLFCDDEERFPQILAGDVIYYPNWQCDGTGKVVHYTKTAGNHTLRFEFGDQLAYAFNQTSIAIRSEASGTGTAETNGNFTITKPTSIVNGDYVIIIVGKDDDVDINTEPTGFTCYELNSSTGDDITVNICYKKITNAAGETDYLFDADASEEWSYWIGSLSGINATIPEDVSFTGIWAYTQNDTTPPAASVTTATNRAFVFAIWYAFGSTSTTQPNPLDPWASRASSVGTANDLQVISQTKASYGATGSYDIGSVSVNADTQSAQFAFRVGNSVPEISSVADGPDAVQVGQTITFSTAWSDADVEGVKMLICKTDAITAAASPTCTVAEWCSDKDTYDTNTPLSCNYTITSGDVGIQNYYAFVCDNEPNCNASGTAGTFTAKVNGSPALKFEGGIILRGGTWIGVVCVPILTNLFNGTGQGFTGGSQANGGVDDYNNAGSAPTDRYSGTWTACTSGADNYCGTGDAFADMKDNNTGLVWSKPCSGVGCSTSAEPADTDYEWTYTDDADNNGMSASVLCSQDLGTTHDAGWSLPHQKQLMQAYIDGSYGNLEATGVGGNRNYWSATTLSTNTINAWYFYLSNGNTSNLAKSFSNYVRCVRQP